MRHAADIAAEEHADATSPLPQRLTYAIGCRVRDCMWWRKGDFPFSFAVYLSRIALLYISSESYWRHGVPYPDEVVTSLHYSCNTAERQHTIGDEVVRNTKNGQRKTKRKRKDAGRKRQWRTNIIATADPVERSEERRPRREWGLWR